MVSPAWTKTGTRSVTCWPGIASSASTVQQIVKQTVKQAGQEKPTRRDGSVCHPTSQEVKCCMFLLYLRMFQFRQAATVGQPNFNTL